MQTLPVLLLVVAASLPWAESLGFWRANLPDLSTDLGINGSIPALPRANGWPRPKPTPAFMHSAAVLKRLEQSMSALQVETLGKNTCGFFTLSKDVPRIPRTRVCDATKDCTASNDYLGCGGNAIVTCLAFNHPLCGQSQVRGKNTLCCMKSNGYNGECQTFIRSEGALGDKTLLACREDDIAWDPIVYLQIVRDFITSSSTSSAETRTTPTPDSSTPSDMPTPSVPSAPTLSMASSTNAPTSGPTGGGAPSVGSQTGAIVGGVLGSLTILAIAGCVATWLVVRRRRAVSGRGSSGHVSPSPSHELAGDQPCVSPKEGGGEQYGYQPMSPVSACASSSAQREVFQAPASDAIGSAMKPAELG
ncbi:hypothetical protein CORC01_10131 [Colletotrichum orchidophilum]|uniref:Uncharacterized protein n=1 Tax=Colletotrichum orchidophilum TaxID=1209926 RepID=A0A1G4AZU0_9PEZI|nr:uncharacterized protein CORC01_10131 [Colletotrichum orchidophilum]OHE94603.1 hypothetical protein CORC01_10131 [Colletotrichum orchidophilum]